MAKKNRKVLGKFQSDALTNSMKTLLANIRFAALDSPIKTIVVTSSVMDEGKSTVASNLSCAIASSGKRVLIVDADLRRRSLGNMLGLHNSNGIYSVLSGKASLREAVSATEIPNLFFMDCEPNIPNPADIFATKRFAVLMDKLASSFDYVIIDTSPIGLFVDAAVVSNLADGTLVVVRQGSTKRDIVEKAIQQLQAADANILGLVMTFVEQTRNSYYYYAYYNEEGKRVRREHKREEALVDDPAEVTLELADDNIEDWMEATGVTVPEQPRTYTAPRVAAREDVRTSTRSVRQQAPADDPFAPGAFRSDPGTTGAIRTRARHGSR